jgi:hypothetical protein
MNARTVILAATAAATLGLLATAPASAGPITRRACDQQRRIAQGFRSGALTAREGLRLERREVRLGREVVGLRRANGGVLTRPERCLVNHQQNRLSRAIFRQKHDRQRRW